MLLRSIIAGMFSLLIAEALIAEEGLSLNGPEAKSETVKKSVGDEAVSGSPDRKVADEASAAPAEKAADAEPKAREFKDYEQATSDPALTPQLIKLRNKVRRCLVHYFNQPENADRRSPWGVMHSAVAFGVDTQLQTNGGKVNALGWLCWNLPCRGQRFFYTYDGKLQTRQGSGVQGHEGQFLAVLAQSRVKEDYVIKVDGYEFTVADLIEHEKQTCAPGTELTFKLIGLSHYLDSDETWQDKQGREWSIARLIQEELKQPVVEDAACGGTHRMMGFSYAVRNREKGGQPMTGQWKRAKKYVDDYHKYTFTLQNSDGSFSTEWFRYRSDDGGRERRLQTSGHILEWLAYSLSDDQLREERTIKAVDYLAQLLVDYPNYNWEVGPLGHALHALVLYDQRVFGGRPGQGGPKLPAGVSPVDATARAEPMVSESDDDDEPRRRFRRRRRR